MLIIWEGSEALLWQEDYSGGECAACCAGRTDDEYGMDEQDGGAGHYNREERGKVTDDVNMLERKRREMEKRGGRMNRMRNLRTPESRRLGRIGVGDERGCG